MTDYVVFIHGVNVRDASFASPLLELIKQQRPVPAFTSIQLSWSGKLNQYEDEISNALEQEAAIWNQMWYHDIRNDLILPFLGDASLYISRSVGSAVIGDLFKSADEALEPMTDGDRLHLVGHSWGTVLLFDVLFSDRWDLPDELAKLSPEELKRALDHTKDEIEKANIKVALIRSRIFGLHPDQEHGVRLASITTMACPIAIFSLLFAKAADKMKGRSHRIGQNTHDIRKNMRQLLYALADDLAEKKRPPQPLLWNNLCHPGDPLALPITTLIHNLLFDPTDFPNPSKFVEVNDRLIKDAGMVDIPCWAKPLLAIAKCMFKITQSQFELGLGLLGSAHNCYFKSTQVAKHIVALLRRANA